MRHDLVAVEIEIDPRLGAPPLRTPERPALEGARGGEIVDGKGEVKGAQAHMVKYMLVSQIAKQGRKLCNHNEMPG